eukprot:scaffold44459_cov122-Amphora_coffeaeformis.AAC.2
MQSIWTACGSKINPMRDGAGMTCWGPMAAFVHEAAICVSMAVLMAQEGGGGRGGGGGEGSLPSTLNISGAGF